MQNNDFRAKQFLPFDALKGFKETISLIEKVSEEKKYLSLDKEIELNNIIINLKNNDKIKITYYKGFNYIETIDNIKKIDYVFKKIYLKNTIISFDDIIDIKII